MTLSASGRANHALSDNNNPEFAGLADLRAREVQRRKKERARVAAATARERQEVCEIVSRCVCDRATCTGRTHSDDSGPSRISFTQKRAHQVPTNVSSTMSQ